MPRKTPQQKKRESYSKDRRNAYGENSKSSRKNIRRRKKAVNRANRRGEHQVMSVPVTDGDAGEQAEEQVTSKRPKAWSKVGDVPLGEIVVRKLKRRERLGIDSAGSVKRKLKRVKRHRSG